MDFGTSGKRASRLIRPRTIAAFTLVEMLTVVAIILILATLTIGIAGYANRRAAVTRIKAEIRAMELALEAYKADYGTYPPWNQTGMETTFTLAAMTNQSASGAWRGWTNIGFVYRALSSTNSYGKVYMTFHSRQIVSNFWNGIPAPCFLIVDPLGTPYGYNPVSPLVNKQSFDLFSCGLDGVPNYTAAGVNTVTNDDIGNW